MKQRSEKVKPKGTDDPLPAVPSDPTPSQADRDKAGSLWDRLMPDYAGLLDSTVEGLPKVGSKTSVDRERERASNSPSHLQKLSRVPSV
ncbi:MAG TPA: hypothetical protein VI756_15015 [Blastocatellia bacterium]